MIKSNKKYIKTTYILFFENRGDTSVHDPSPCFLHVQKSDTRISLSCTLTQVAHLPRVYIKASEGGNEHGSLVFCSPRK